MATEPDAVVRVYADSENNVQVVTQAGTTVRSHTVARQPGQVGIDSVKISKNGNTAGWLVLYENPDVGTPFAGKLVLWRDGRVVLSFGTGRSFWSWSFVNGDRQVAYHIGPTHGETASHCELHDTRAGHLLASWDGDLTSVDKPPWTKKLSH